MHDFSEAGYAYLGVHLASRGFIVATVDENFLNPGSWGELGIGGLAGDNAARGYLLLHHLRALRGWNEAPGNPLHGKVDLTRVALMGHSRGGEAITAAAKLNSMSRAPDNALIHLDFHFGIRALVAIATTDRQYQPGGRALELDDVSYLALQGSNDGDVDYFQGAQQYERVRFTQPGTRSRRWSTSTAPATRSGTRAGGARTSRPSRGGRTSTASRSCRRPIKSGSPGGTSPRSSRRRCSGRRPMCPSSRITAPAPRGSPTPSSSAATHRRARGRSPTSTRTSIPPRARSRAAISRGRTSPRGASSRWARRGTPRCSRPAPPTSPGTTTRSRASPATR